MQFSQPAGFEQYGHTPFQCNGYPEIIGEGNVTSIVLPNGATQFLFLPTAQWWRPPIPNIANINHPQWNSLGAWFIRRVDNPYQPTLINPQFPCGIDYQRVTDSDYNLDIPQPDIQLKFHNDNYTSTSDMHYFCTKQYNLFCKPQGCASVQVDIPVYPPAHETLCSKPCHCIHKEPPICDTNGATQKHICRCKQSNSSDMSCDDEYRTKIRSKNIANKKSRRKSQSSVKCYCKKPKASDKCVTTYADEATGAIEEKGRVTQTDTIPIVRVYSTNLSDKENVDIETEKRQKYERKKSSVTFRSLCSRCTSSSGNCSCVSDTDMEQ